MTAPRDWQADLAWIESGPDKSELADRAVDLWPAAIREAMRVPALEAEVERLTRDRDDARQWAKNWEAACEAKCKQLDSYDEKVAASEMIAIERSACDSAMREMEIARHERDAARADFAKVAESGVQAAEALHNALDLVDRAQRSAVQAVRERAAALSDAAALRECLREVMESWGLDNCTKLLARARALLAKEVKP